jgi:DNA invertase Pin-like site-specific DNA recombinase
MIPERTKAALQAAKARGKVLGNPNLREAAKRGTEAASANARRFAANVRPIIDEIVRAGATSHNAIAAKLNERNVRTARGGVWAHYRLEQSCTLSAAQAAPTHDGYKGSAVNLSIGRLCYVR